MKRIKIGKGLLAAAIFGVMIVAVPVMAAEPEPETITDEIVVLKEDNALQVTLSQTSVTLHTTTQSTKLTVTVSSSDYDSVSWTSEKSAVATVDNTGTVKAVGNGTTKITATVTAGGETVSEYCTVTVSLYDDEFQQDPDGSDWYYYKSGAPDTAKTDVMEGTVNGTHAWWNVVKGKVTPGVTVAKNKNSGVWWYIDAEGKADFTYTGFAANANGKWYCEEGKVTFKTQDILKDTNGAFGEKGAWYYVIGSKVQTDFTGLSNFSNKNGWWYIKKGKVDFTHNGVDKNKNGWWYVTGGKVQFGYTGLANYKNSNGWWYIKSGKVDFTHNGVDKNKNGWWYVSGGKVKFSFNGIASNSNGMWVIKNGKVNFSYNGTYKYQGVSYKVKNGKASLPLGMSQSMYTKAQSMSSSTKWLILVDTSACRVGIFNGSKGSWTATKYWECSPGKPSTPTKKGSFTVKSKGKSFGKNGYTCWYYTQFYGDYLFHSVLYKTGSKTQLYDGRLGQQLSHGCVRLALENAKWIYDNIPIGTKVYIY